MNDQEKANLQHIEELADLQQRVAESEVFRSLFRESSVGTVVVTPSGRFIQVNRAFSDFLGYSESELVGQTVLSVTHPEDREASSTAIRHAAESTARIQRLEKRYLHKSGQVVWGEVSSTLICDAEGKPSYFITQVLDISERKRAEEALKKAHNDLEEKVKERTAELQEANQRLQQSHDELGAIYDGLAEGLLVTDIETMRFLRANASICRMLGYSETELQALSVVDVHPAEAIPHILERIHSIEHANYLPAKNIPFLRKDGNIFYVEVISKFLNYHGRRCSMGIFRDVTERMQAEAALAESEAKYRQLVETTDTGFLILDDEGLVVDANQEYVRISGHHDLAEIVGRSVVEWTVPYDRPRNAQEIKLCIQAGRIRQLEIDYIGPDGKITPVEINASVIATKEGRHIISLCRDITERRHAQEALEQERQSLWRMLQASDHERQTISYDIHDGLAQYLAAAGMHFQAHDSLKENSPDDAEKAYETAVELVHQAHSESRRLISEVRHPIIDESGLETAISHLVFEQQQYGGPQVECRSSVQFDRLQPILENALYRIVQEALTNACKHSKSKKVAVAMIQEGQDVRLEVRDWGIGFDIDSIGKGHFGLESIRQRARLLGGRLTIQSTPDSGTLVQVVVPILEKQTDPH